MDGTQIIGIIGAIVGGIGGVAALIKTFFDRKAGIDSADRDWNKILWDRTKADYTNTKEENIKLLGELAQRDDRIRLQAQDIDLLLAHINNRLPPPPPPLKSITGAPPDEL